MKLLLDENISPAAALALRADGLDVYHVRDRGLLGATDPELFARAYAEDRIVVTSNVGDFEKLARAQELHAGSSSSSGPGSSATSRSRCSGRSPPRSPSTAR